MHGRWRPGSQARSKRSRDAIVPSERVSKLLDHDSDRIVAAIDAPSCLLDRQGYCFVVAFLKTWPISYSACTEALRRRNHAAAWSHTFADRSSRQLVAEMLSLLGADKL